MTWTITGTVIFFAFVGVALIVMVVEAVAAARSAPVTMERVEYADAAAAAAEREQLRQEMADLFVYAEGVRDQIRMPPFVGVIDPEHTEHLGSVLEEGPALEKTMPMWVSKYTSNGRGVEPTRRET